MIENFFTTYRSSIEKGVRNLINNKDTTFRRETVRSTRAIGDNIKEIVCQGFGNLLEEEYRGHYSSEFLRKSMENLSFRNQEGFYFGVDVTTHCLGTTFNRPNLVSLKRLKKFYESDNNCFALLFVSYRVIKLSISVENVIFVPIEYLDWNCLSIGAIGTGQIQIKDSNNIRINDSQNREAWMSEFSRRAIDFYGREISKIETRIREFRES